MNIDVDKIVVSLDVVAPDAVVVEASAMLPTQVVVISDREIPTVTPLEIVDFSASSIECAFDVTTEQAEEVVRGVLCGLENPPTFENADYRLLHGQGNMDLVFAGLEQNTEYYLRPYALSNIGYKYGDVVAQRTKNNQIPEEYQLVEWLFSSGSQIIDTLVVINDLNSHEYEIETTFTYDASTGQQVQTMLGSFSDGSNRNWFVSMYPVGRQNFGIGTTNFNAASIDYGKVYKCEIYARSGLFKIVRNGIQIAELTDMYAGNNFSLALFGWKQGYNLQAQVNGKCYYLTIKRDSTYIRQMYPVYRKSDRKPGMYDIVNDVFYTNQGSSEFVVGPDKEWDE